MQVVRELSQGLYVVLTELGDGTWEAEVSWMHNTSDPVLLYRPTFEMAWDDVVAWVD